MPMLSRFAVSSLAAAAAGYCAFGAVQSTRAGAIPWYMTGVCCLGLCLAEMPWNVKDRIDLALIEVDKNPEYMSMLSEELLDEGFIDQEDWDRVSDEAWQAFLDSDDELPLAEWPIEHPLQIPLGAPKGFPRTSRDTPELFQEHRE